MSKTNVRQLPAVLGYACLLLLPSFDIPLKYLGVAGMVAYFFVGLICIVVSYYLIVPRLQPMISERAALVLLAMMFVVLIVIVAVLYPLANSGRFGGGSDMDDALILGASELTSGRYPYYKETYLGPSGYLDGMVAIMPGAIFLAVPFVLLNILAFQNIFWLGALALAVKRFVGKYKYSLLTVGTLLAISPTAYQVLATGSDHLTNTLYVLVSMWLVIKAVTSPSASASSGLLAAVFFGIALSSRSNFFLCAPLFFSVLVQAAGWKTAFKYSAVAGATFIAVTLPFYLYDPANFAPAIVQAGKIRELAQVLPGATVIIPLSSFLLSGLLSFTKMESDCAAFFRNCAIVQLFALYLPAMVYVAGAGRLTLFMGSAGYGMFSLVFAVTSVWIYLVRESTPKDAETVV